MPPPYADPKAFKMGDEPDIVWDVEKLCEKLGTTVDEVATTKTIDWGWKELYPEHAQALGDLLSKAENVVNLNMFVNEVGIEGGKAIGRALPFMKKLVQVDLQQWQIEPEGAPNPCPELISLVGRRWSTSRRRAWRSCRPAT